MTTLSTESLAALRSEIESLRAENARLAGKSSPKARAPKSAPMVGDFLLYVGGKDFEMAPFLAETAKGIARRLPVGPSKSYRPDLSRIYVVAKGRIFGRIVGATVRAIDGENGRPAYFLAWNEIEILEKAPAYDGNFFAGLSLLSPEDTARIEAGEDVSVLVETTCSECGKSYPSSPDSANLEAREMRKIAAGKARTFFPKCPACRARGSAERATLASLEKARAENARLKASAA